MSTLRYRDVEHVHQLAVGECMLRRAADEHGSYWHLIAKVQRTDNGQTTLIGVPCLPGGDPFDKPRNTWGFKRTAPGVWQVSPSIDVKSGVGADRPSIWHETPAVVDAPEPPPWEDHVKIHACLMTQNELPDLIANVDLLLHYGTVDTVTIVDGGSIDGTIPYFRNWSNVDPRVRFFIHPWTDNFPEQRNNYLRRVGEIAQNGDWILAVDPDEYLTVEALAELRRLPGVVSAKPERFRRVGFRCRSVSLRGAQRVWSNEDDYRKGLLFAWQPALRYTHAGEGAVHETLLGADPFYSTGHHPEFPSLFYEHRKQENVTWPRGVRNYFIGGGGPNLGSKNHRWVELRAITGRLGLATWHQMHAYLIRGNIDRALADWIIKYRREDGWDGASEQREWFKTYYRMFHPEEQPAELRDEVLP